MNFLYLSSLDDDLRFVDYGGQPRRRRLFGMRSFMFGQKSQDRAASLPESKKRKHTLLYYLCDCPNSLPVIPLNKVHPM